MPVEGGQARPLTYDLAPGFSVAAALFTPDRPSDAGVIVAHGHFGQGKNSAEAQEVALRLVARGVTVLAVDTPGVEEYDMPDWHVHGEEGGHNRALLAAAGTSALALQVASLRRGLDLLAERGVTRFAATGASGGAVQSFYLLLADPRVAGAALASCPPMPREARAGGCPCDLIPGWPGPDPGVLALVDRPLLWMSETAQPRPEGLPRGADFELFEGPHSYTAAMQDRALRWLQDRLGIGAGPVLDAVPTLDLRTPGPGVGARSIRSLVAGLPRTAPPWRPAPAAGEGYALDCAGAGPRVLVGGGEPDDAAALLAAGLSPCAVRLTDDGEVSRGEALARGVPFADRVAGAFAEAARRSGAVAAYGARAWGYGAAGSGLPYVVRDPVLRLDAVDPARDPDWIHVPGAWWGALDGLYADALATGTDPTALAAALAAVRPGRAGPPGPADR